MSNLKQIYVWLKKQKKRQKIIIKEKNISELHSWKYNSEEIYHISKKFFSIVGLRVISNFYKHNTWDQPIIYQNENGILGIIRRNKNGKPINCFDKFQGVDISKVERNNLILSVFRKLK